MGSAAWLGRVGEARQKQPKTVPNFYYKVFFKENLGFQLTIILLGEISALEFLPPARFFFKLEVKIMEIILDQMKHPSFVFCTF